MPPPLMRPRVSLASTPQGTTPDLLDFARAQVTQQPQAPAAAPMAYQSDPMLPTSPQSSSFGPTDPTMRAMMNGRSISESSVVGRTATGAPVYESQWMPPTSTPAQAPAPARRALVRPGRARAQAQAAPAVQAAPDPIEQLMANGSGVQAPQRGPLDTARDSLALDQSFAMQRANEAQAVGETVADAEREYQRAADRTEEERRQAVGQARDAVNRAQARAASMSIDQDRASRGGNGVMNALAVALGTFGSTLAGGPNAALQIVNERIERDIESQRADIDQANSNVAAQRSMLADVREEFRSRDAATEATRAAMLRQAAAEAEVRSRQTDSDEVRTRAQNLRDQLEEQAAAAAQAAQAAEAEARLTMADREAQLRRHSANATLAEANAQRALMRLQGRPGGAPPAPQRVSSAQMQAVQAMMASGVSRETAAASAGLPVSVAAELQQAPLDGDSRAAIDALDSTLRTLETSAARGEADGDIAGVGMVDSLTPSWMQSDDAIRTRMALDNAVDQIGRLRSGAAISAAEEERFLRILQGSGTEREFRIGLEQVRREVAARLGMGGRASSTGDAARGALMRLGARPVQE